MTAKVARNRNRKPRNQRAGAKQKETAFDRVSRETDELMWEVAAIADKLLDILPRFKRLSGKNRQIVYDHIDVCVNGLCGAVDEYEDALPSPTEEQRPYREGASLVASGIALVGLMSLFGAALSERGGDSRRSESDGAIDIEGRKVARKPRMLNPKPMGNS